MKNFLTTAWVLCLITVTTAQNYFISFAGTGASSNVDSVLVENLSQCTNMTINGSDILNLTTTVGIEDFNNVYEGSVQVYPNPSAGDFSIEFDVAMDERISIVLYEVTGKTILQTLFFMHKGHHVFSIKGLSTGFYPLQIVSAHCIYTAKLISNGSKSCIPEISYSGQLNRIDLPKKNKHHNKAIISMLFNAGDTLKLTGKSGQFRTVKMLFPTQDDAVTFDFTVCTDADSNHYAVVQIGNQLWMQENLKTTHYRDGSPIPNVTDSATWGSLSSGAYCNYHNDTTEGNYYGRLYNFYAVADTRNICPAGWHVASNPEWNILEKFLDQTVDTSASAWMGRGTIIGRILKESCNTRWAYLDTTWGLNSAGFSALCANFRNNTGAWSLAPNNDHDDAFWTSTPYSVNTAWGLSLRWCFSDIYVMPLINMKSGSSVRCIKD